MSKTCPTCGHVLGDGSEILSVNGRVVYLSERETQVIKLYGQSEMMKVVATALNISIKTASTYKVRAFKKLGIENRCQLAMFLLHRGWIKNTFANADANRA